MQLDKQSAGHYHAEELPSRPNRERPCLEQEQHEERERNVRIPRLDELRAEGKRRIRERQRGEDTNAEQKPTATKPEPCCRCDREALEQRTRNHDGPGRATSGCRQRGEQPIEDRARMIKRATVRTD